ncbi:Lrp/AsnC family transcriptional regulator [Streptomyces sp. CT34]|uniref:Lrp/AsnC family transcriptional regulator n=1 Tax=Streptomyces sp. CT34 TaxID=1553907 RepID=UPI00099BA92E|nr:Lrp/AsnC family transcriptional regulator [Streptomyces sp. CT34]
MRKTNDIDESIVWALAGDARRSYADIGAEVGRSASAVKRRVDKLCQEGALLGFTIRVDPALGDRQTEGAIELFCRPKTTPETIRRGLSQYPEVVSASTVTGNADALVQVSTSGIEHFEQVLKRIEAEPFVERTRSTLLSPLIRNSQPNNRIDE